MFFSNICMKYADSEQIVDFDKSLKKSDEDGLKPTWAIVSAMSLWLNEVDQGPLLGNSFSLPAQFLKHC